MYVTSSCFRVSGDTVEVNKSAYIAYLSPFAKSSSSYPSVKGFHLSCVKVSLLSPINGTVSTLLTLYTLGFCTGAEIMIRWLMLSSPV